MPLGTKIRMLYYGLRSTSSLEAWVAKSYQGYSFISTFKKPKLKDSFRSLYIAALYNYIRKYNKPSFILNLFSKGSVIQAFTKEYNDRTRTDFVNQLTLEIGISEELSNLNINIRNELELFRQEFDKVVQSIIPPSLAHLKQALSTKDLSDEFLISSLDSQVQKQLSKQKSTGKYIPDTFIELRDEKDKIRFFCHPILFSKKLNESLQGADFRHLNNKLKQKSLPPFDLDANKVYNYLNAETIADLDSRCQFVNEHLSQKLQNLEQLNDNAGNYYPFNERFARN